LLDNEHVEHINEGVRELIANTGDQDDVTPAPSGGKAEGGALEEEEPPSPPDLPVLQDLPPGWSGTPILCVAGRGPFDEAVAMMFEALLARHGLGCRREADVAVSSSNIVHLNGAGVKVVCFSYLDLGASPAHLRHSVQRIRKRIPGAALVVGLWGHEDMPDRERLPTIVPADCHVFSLREALRVCIAAASDRGDKPDAARDPKSGTAAA
jgi:hypothetical protein